MKNTYVPGQLLHIKDTSWPLFYDGTSSDLTFFDQNDVVIILSVNREEIKVLSAKGVGFIFSGAFLPFDVSFSSHLKMKI